MKFFALSLLALVWHSILPSLHDSTARLNDYKIASAVRKAVREADSTLFQTTVSGGWRDYLKIAAIELNLDLQPLLLIKFDEDSGFRSQLKTIIGWEATFQRQETEHFIYYYHWDYPIPEMILEIPEIQFRTITKMFEIEALEKIPYRYDVSVKASVAYPYDDLRGGIVSPQPFDLESSALATFYFINSEPRSLLQPLARIYGSYFQNPSTAEAYFEKCLDEIKKDGYVSAADMFADTDFENSETARWYSTYAFVYALNEQFKPPQIKEFLQQVDSSISKSDFQTIFAETFATGLADFEVQLSSTK